MDKEVSFTGILSNKPEENPGFLDIPLILLFINWNGWNFTLPANLKFCWSARLLSYFGFTFNALADFFNWNRVKLRYCDGASFLGDDQNKVSVQSFTGSIFHE